MKGSKCYKQKKRKENYQCLRDEYEKENNQQKNLTSMVYLVCGMIFCAMRMKNVFQNTYHKTNICMLKCLENVCFPHGF